MERATGESRNLLSLLQGYEGRGWDRNSSATEEQIMEAERALNIQFSTEYRQFLAYSDGGEIAIHENKSDFGFFYLEELVQLNPHPIWSKRLPDKVLFFATDNGEYAFYFDTENKIGRGEWAVYCIEMGYSSIENSIYLGENLTHFIERVLRGENVLDAPYLKDEGIFQNSSQ